jgi:pimeloyl-ACP methyl ester carboxylesterase
VAAAGLFASWVAFLVVRFMVRVFLADPGVTFAFATADEDTAADAAAGGGGCGGAGPAASVAAGDAGSRVEPHRFCASDGVELAGTLVRAACDPPHGLVVFCPEHGGDMRTWRRYASFLPAHGYALFTFDFRGTGASVPGPPGYVPRRWASAREVADLEGALAHARRLDGSRYRAVALFGISRGGLTSLAVAARDPDVLGVVLEGSGSTRDVIHDYTVKWSRVYAPEWLCAAIPDALYRAVARLVMALSEGLVGYRFVEIERLPACASGGSCLFINGDRDRFVDPAMARRIFAARRGPKEHWIVPGARHNGAVTRAPEEYSRRILAHVDRLFARDRAGNPAGDRVPAALAGRT